MSLSGAAIFPLPMDKENPEAVGQRPAAGRFCFENTPRLSSALRQGDEDAFRWFHEQWNGRIFRYCFSLARGDEALAGELTQATYLRIFRHVRELPDEAALWNWVTRAARCAASDSRRIGGRYRGAIARFAEWFRPRQFSSLPGFEPESSTDDLLDALENALAQLSTEENALIERRYSQRHSLEEIGLELGVSARAIEGRLARLRKKLRELMIHKLRTRDSKDEEIATK